MHPIYEELKNVNDPEVLREYSLHLIKTVEGLQNELKIARAEREKEIAAKQLVLDDQLVVLRRVLFDWGSERRGVSGRKREKKKDEQFLLQSQSLVPAPQKQERKKIQQQVRIVEASEEQLAEEAQIRELSNNWEKIEGLFEKAKQITVIERRYKEILTKRQKYRHVDSTADNQIIVTADDDREKLLPGCRYSTDFALQVVLDKYLYHLPLERQRRQMEALGLTVYPKTLSNLVGTVSIYMESVAEKIAKGIFGCGLVPNLDETPWPINNSKDKDGQMWIFSNQAGSFYRFEPTRSGKVPKETLKKHKYSGVTLSDGYTGYNRLKELDVQLAYCWAHARRKFIEIEANYPKPCKEVLDEMDKLFSIEHEAKDYDHLKELRQTKSKPILDRIYKWLVQKKTEARDQTGLQKAIDYNLKHWDGLTRFIENPKIPLTNNDAERGLRQAVMGRKNFHGSRTIDAADCAAILYSVIESCKKVELDPKGYLKMALTRAIKKEAPITPLEYAKSIRSQ